MDELLRGITLANSVNCVHLNAAMDPHEIVDRLVAEILALAPLDAVVVR